jgi:hypothetical protein
MSGTVQTEAQLLAGFPSSGPAGGITPTQMQNLTASTVAFSGLDDPNNASTLGAPAIIRGTVYLQSVSGLTLGAGQTLTVRQANATALQAAFDYAAANNKIVEYEPNTIEIDNTTGILWDNSNYNNFTLRGTSKSIISQFHANAPLLIVANSVQLSLLSVDGLGLAYGSTQTGNTSAITCQLGDMWRCSFKKMSIGTFGASSASNYPDKALRIFSANSGASFFSNEMEDVYAQGAQTSLFSKEIFGTGNTYRNIYLTNTVGNGVSTAITAPFVVNSGGASDTESVFEELNIEWCATQIMMNLNVSQAHTFISAHFEGIKMTGSNPRFVYLQGGASANFLGCDWLNPIIQAANFTNTAAMVVFGAAGPCNMTGCVIQDAIGGNVTSNFLVYRPELTTFVPIGTVDNMMFSGLAGFAQLDSTTPIATYGPVDQVGGYSYPVRFARTRRSRISNPSGTSFTLFGNAGAEVFLQYTTALGAATTLVLAGKYANGSDPGNTIACLPGHQVQLHVPAGVTSATNTLTVHNLTSGGTTLTTLNTTGASDTYYAFDGTNWAAI